MEEIEERINAVMKKAWRGKGGFNLGERRRAPRMAKMWQRARKLIGPAQADRIALLQLFALCRVKPPRGSGSRADRRHAHNQRWDKAEPGACWACGATGHRVAHHVVQLQHGGTNWHLNIEAVCKRCHAEIHPWLKSGTTAPIDV